MPGRSSPKSRGRSSSKSKTSSSKSKSSRSRTPSTKKKANSKKTSSSSASKRRNSRSSSRNDSTDRKHQQVSSTGPTIPEEFMQELGALQNAHVLVTGGSGFLGRNIVELALEAGATVTVFDIFIREYLPEMVEAGRLTFTQGDLLKESDVYDVLQGVEYVIHVASPSPLSGNEALFMRVNVEGTRNLLEQCRAHSMRYFVYTSSASVVFDGTDQEFQDETHPLPAQPMDAYTKSKLRAEELVLSNSDKTLYTVALRPHGIFGPNDVHFIPNLAQAGAAGKTKWVVGSGNNIVDFTYVTNVAYSHLLAAVRLGPKKPLCGQAYFITNKEPVLMWNFMGQILAGLDLTQPKYCLPAWLMMGIASVTDVFAGIFKSFKPTFTVQRVRYLTTHHYYDCSKATRDFGYEPPIPMSVALERTLASFEAKKAKTPAARYEPTSRLLKGIYVAVLLAAVVYASIYFEYADALLSHVGGVQSLTSVSDVHRRLFDMSKQDLHGKNCVITGGNKGIGFATAKELAGAGCHVILACRNQDRALAAIDQIKAAHPEASLGFVECDLSNLESVSYAVEDLVKGNVKIDFLVNNAGGKFGPAVTEEGFDLQYASNHLGHFLLTRLLLDNGCIRENGRIVTVSSLMHAYGNILDFLHSKGKMEVLSAMSDSDRYSATKLMNILFSHELQRRVLGPTSVSSVAVHPGLVNTDFILHYIPRWLKWLFTWFFAIITTSPYRGAQSTLYALLAPELSGIGGLYIADSRIAFPAPQATDWTSASELWNLSESQVAAYRSN